MDAKSPPMFISQTTLHLCMADGVHTLEINFSSSTAHANTIGYLHGQRFIFRCFDSYYPG